MKEKLAMVAVIALFVLVGATGFAATQAPVISGAPDVIIGDLEDNLTMDVNWFRYVNAFNILDFVSDEDSTPSVHLKFAFLEETTYIDLLINDKSQIAAADWNNPSAWGSNEITGFGGTRNFLLSFLDVLRNPVGMSPPYPDPVDAAGDPVPSGTVQFLPWQTDEGNPLVLSGDSRMVHLFAADEFDNVGTETILVMSLNHGFDALSHEVNTVFEDDFSNGPGTLWAWNQIGIFAVCTSGSATGAGGYLSIESGGDPGGSGVGDWFYGRWATYNPLQGLQGVIDHVDGDVLYRANLTLRQDQATVGNIGRTRMGVQQIWLAQATMNVNTPVPSAGPEYNPNVPAQGVNQDIAVLWSANSDAPGFDDLLNDFGAPFGVLDGRTWNLFFDIFDDQDTQLGTWTMDDVRVETIPTPAAVSPTVSFTDFRTSNGWTQTLAGGMTIQELPSPAGVVIFRDPGASGSTRNFALLQHALPGLPWNAGQTIRVSTTIACPDAAARTNFHRFRVRTFTAGFHVQQQWFLGGDDGGTLTFLGMPSMPPVYPTTHSYETYVPSFGGTTPELTAYYGTDQWTAALDQVHNVLDPVYGTTHMNATGTGVMQMTFEVLNVPDVF